MSKQRKRHTPEQIVKKLRDAEAMLNAGKDLSAVIQSLQLSAGFRIPVASPTATDPYL